VAAARTRAPGAARPVVGEPPGMWGGDEPAACDVGGATSSNCWIHATVRELLESLPCMRSRMRGLGHKNMANLCIHVRCMLEKV
jgi:hypothetical protein